MSEWPKTLFNANALTLLLTALLEKERCRTRGGAGSSLDRPSLSGDTGTWAAG
jgi:hypothetical protein